MFWLHMANIPEEEGGVHWEDWPVIFLSRIIPVFFFFGIKVILVSLNSLVILSLILFLEKFG